MCQVCGSWGADHQLRMPRRTFLTLGGAFAATLASDGGAEARGVRRRRPPERTEATPPKPENVLSPDQSLARLMAGNQRYRQGVSKRHDFLAEREALVGGQNPFAGILSCADSRIAPEYAFDSSRGDLFVVRVAGNFVNPDNIASFEFAVEVLKTPLLLVLGHEGCGAVKSTISSIQDKTTLPGHLPSLVAALAPAVKAATGRPGDLLENATRENVRLNVEALKNATPLLSAAVNNKRVNIVGGVYRMADGRVEILA